MSKVKGKIGKDMRPNDNNTHDTGKEIGDDKYGPTGARRGAPRWFLYNDFRLFQTVQMTCTEAGGGTPTFWRSRRGNLTREVEFSPVTWESGNGKQSITQETFKGLPPPQKKEKPK